MTTPLRAILLTAIAASALAACSESAFLPDPVEVCRCAPTEVCIENRCVVPDALLLDAPGSDAPDFTEVSCTPGPVVINELRYADADTADYLELRADEGLSLEGYQVVATTEDGLEAVRASLEGEVGESGLYLAAFGAGVEEADAQVAEIGFPPAGTIEVLDCAGGLTDAIAYGDLLGSGTTRGEGTPAGSAGEGETLARCTGDLEEVDTGDNAEDFFSAEPSPGAANDTVPRSACTGCVAGETDGRLFISELLYDPPGSDPSSTAFVELRGDAGLVVSGVTVEIYRESRQEWSALGVLEGELPEDGRLLIVENEELEGDFVLDGVDLSNIGAGLRILACDGALLDHVAYGDVTPDGSLGIPADDLAMDVPDNTSLARCPDEPTLEASGDFVAQMPPTPGEANSCDEAEPEPEPEP